MTSQALTQIRCDVPACETAMLGKTEQIIRAGWRQRPIPEIHEWTRDDVCPAHVVDHPLPKHVTLRDSLTELVQWATRPQPQGASMSHLGTSGHLVLFEQGLGSTSTGGLHLQRLMFVLEGLWTDMPLNKNEQIGLTEKDRENVVQILADLNVRITDEWNGPPYHSWSLVTDAGVHESVLEMGVGHSKLFIPPKHDLPTYPTPEPQLPEKYREENAQ